MMDTYSTLQTNDFVCRPRPPSSKGRKPTSRQPCNTSHAYIALQEMDALFSAGDVRGMAYRVEAGALLISMTDGRGAHYHCEIAKPGDYVGLGFLETHTTSAYALMPSTLSCVPLSAIKQLAAINQDLHTQLTREVSREFDARRAAILSESVCATPKQKLARLLIALSSIAAREKRALNIVSENLECDFIASLLDMDLEALSSTMSEFGSLGLIRKDPETGAVRADCLGLAAIS